MTPIFDAERLKRYDRPGPRYTSYPTVPQFTRSFGPEQLARHAAGAALLPGGLSLYVHVPFCFSPCFYCGCNRLITHDAAQGGRYARYLLRETELVASLFPRRREVRQLHIGGGTPNFLTLQPLEQLMKGLGERFQLSQAAARDYSIELDPRSVPAEFAQALEPLGFNRVSLGVQDFDPVVQRAVNRLQSIDETFDLIDNCRDSGIRSVNVDLIYGLPFQTLSGFRRTLRQVVSARPDRVAVYGYAHLPHMFKAQRQIEATDLPSPNQRLALLQLAIDELSASGYRYVGMDHFALPEDDLVRAQEAGTLQRNFMGYSTHANCDLIGLGMSAISHIGNSFSQNFRELKSWEAALDQGRLPVARGHTLTADDRVRAAVIARLMCQGNIEIEPIEREFDIDFARYFRDALEALQSHAADGLVVLETTRITVTPIGRLLLRSLAMCFDAYLPPKYENPPAPVFSKLV